MDILNSEWLIKMLEKSSQTPHGRLLSLFDILEDWLEAPTIRDHLNEQFFRRNNAKNLQVYLSAEAAKAGAVMPEILANQLCFMAVSAMQARLQVNIHAGASHDILSHDILSHDTLSYAAFKHAKSAANALILAQTRKEFYIAKYSFARVACFLGVLAIAGGSALMFNLNQTQKDAPLAELKSAFPSILEVSKNPTLLSSELNASPDQTVAIMAQLELMRHGNCQLIEAIQLPDSQKGIYLNMVVNGQVSTNPHEQKIALELIKKTRCSYTPMLMANSKS